MKKHKVIIMCICLLICMLFGGCTENAKKEESVLVKVCLELGRGFSAKSYLQEIESQTDAVFELKLQDDYEITECSYPDYAMSQLDNGYIRLTLHKVCYPVRVVLTCEIPETVLFYDPNDGYFAETGSDAALRVACGPSLHYRTNTLSGKEKLLRKGYVLTGWNTKSDGSGDHIGLGSRVTCEKNTELYLYAEWEKETSTQLFDWTETENGIKVTDYKGGDTDSLVIPEYIGEAKVTAIGEGFAKEISVGKLVIPDSVVTIEEKAFVNCSIEAIYFSDSIKAVSDASFLESRPGYWHINAVMEPRYMAISDITAFADKMDLLMLHKAEKKIMLFSGCSMNYGIDSKLLEASYPEYTILNLGAVGGGNAPFQFEIMLHYIQEEDIFIHAPEERSSYQLMSDTECENRMFIAVEGNFDLLSLVDMRSLGEGAFDSLQSFNEKRRIMEACSYEDQNIPTNGYGDNSEERNANNTERFDEEYCLRTDYVTESSLDTLCSYYDRIRQAGALVYLSYAPINELCCTEEEIEEFSKTWEEGMTARGYETISKLKDYVMEAKYFYDTDYHLTTKGALLRTEQLMEDLSAYIK